MTVEEVREKIIELGLTDWANSRVVNLKYPLLGLSMELKGFSAIYEFLLQQVQGFGVYQDLPQQIKNIAKEFDRLRLELVSILQSGNQNERHWKNIISNPISNDNPPKLLYDSAETKFLLDLYSNARHLFLPAYEYITQPSLSNANDKNNLTGYLIAHEFKNQHSSDILKRAKAEEDSIQELKTKFESYLPNSEKHLIDFLERGKTEIESQSTSLTKLVSEKKQLFENWYDKITSEFYAFDLASSEKMKEWETTYREKLKLEAPAQYWSKRAKKLRREGWGWLIGLIISSGIAVGVLIWVLNQIAAGTLEKIFAETGTAIKWSVVMITLVSFLAFLIKTFSKLTFSSFHLVRDAEEREQLTYVYLAMQREKGIDQTERHLIMQSLFSRADSGLLKDDGGPTMPGNIFDQAMKNKG